MYSLYTKTVQDLHTLRAGHRASLLSVVVRVEWAETDTTTITQEQNGYVVSIGRDVLLLLTEYSNKRKLPMKFESNASLLYRCCSAVEVKRVALNQESRYEVNNMFAISYERNGVYYDMLKALYVAKYGRK